MLNQPRRPGSCTSWHSPPRLHQHSTCKAQERFDEERSGVLILPITSPTAVARNALLEELIKAKFAGTLDGVADQSRTPASDQACRPALLDCDAEARADGLVLLVIDLHIALDNVHWRDHGVRQAATEDTADGTGLVKLGRVHCDLLLGGRWDQRAAAGGAGATLKKPISQRIESEER